MHHITLANDIVEEAEKYGNIRAITLEVGELAKATPTQIKEGLAYLNEWDVNVVLKKAVVKCKCGHKGMPKIVDRSHDFIFFECPVCGEVPQVLEGDEIKILSVEKDE